MHFHNLIRFSLFLLSSLPSSDPITSTTVVAREWEYRTGSMERIWSCINKASWNISDWLKKKERKEAFHIFLLREFLWWFWREWKEKKKNWILMKRIENECEWPSLISSLQYFNKEEHRTDLFFFSFDSNIFFFIISKENMSIFVNSHLIDVRLRSNAKQRKISLILF